MPSPNQFLKSLYLRNNSDPIPKPYIYIHVSYDDVPGELGAGWGDFIISRLYRGSCMSDHVLLNL